MKCLSLSNVLVDEMSLSVKGIDGEMSVGEMSVDEMSMSVKRSVGEMSVYV